MLAPNSENESNHCEDGQLCGKAGSADGDSSQGQAVVQHTV